MIYCILTKPHHVEKIVNFLNEKTNIEYFITSERYEIDAFDYDLGVSYCYPWIVNIESKEHKNVTWYNYHPAPLPEYKGVHVYEKAVKNRIKKWGVSLHIMTNEIDSGEILYVYDFNLDSPPVNTNEIGCIAHYKLFQLFKDTIEHLQFKPKNKHQLIGYLKKGRNNYGGKN